MEATPEKRTFEEVLSELEKLAQEMEQRELPLDEAIAKFERGIELSRYCKTLLGTAEGKILQLTKDNQLEDFLKPGEEAARPAARPRLTSDEDDV
jgi:exodeoxyribonuclease VII small subunit